MTRWWIIWYTQSDLWATNAVSAWNPVQRGASSSEVTAGYRRSWWPSPPCRLPVARHFEFQIIVLRLLPKSTKFTFHRTNCLARIRSARSRNIGPRRSVVSISSRLRCLSHCLECKGVLLLFCCVINCVGRSTGSFVNVRESCEHPTIFELPTFDCSSESCVWRSR